MSTFEIGLLVVTHIAAFVIGALIFRNNIAGANKLISRGEAVVDATGKIVKTLKKA